MKKLIVLVLALVCVLSLIGCNETAEIQIDKIVMTHSTDGDKPSEKVTITDKETISELLAMHNSLQKEEKSRPIADERIWVIFYMGDEVEIEWCISAYGNDLQNEEFISCSTLWSKGNYVIKSDFDYTQLVEIFNTKDFDIPDDHTLLGAKILEIHDDYFIVEPSAGMEDLVSANKVRVPTRNADPNTDWRVGDLVLITYDGKVLETYPVQLGQVYKIAKGTVKLTDNTEASN